MSPRSSGRIRVAYSFITMPVGGAEDFAITMANQMPPDIDPCFICLRNFGQAGEELKHQGRWPVHLIPACPRKQWNFGGVDMLADWLHIRGIQIIHSQTYHAHLFSVPAARQAGIHSVLHQQKTLQRDKWHRWKYLARRARSASHVVTLSELTREDMIRKFHVSRLNTSCIPNAVDMSQFEAVQNKAALRRTHHIPEDQFIYVIVASLKPDKNHDAIIDLAAALKHQQASSLIIVCGDGISREPLQQTIRQRGLEPYILLGGNKRPVAPWMQMADAMLMPSHWEGLPLSVLQGKSCGLPVIASGIEGNMAALGDNHPGLTTPGDNRAFVSTALRILQDPIFRNDVIAYQEKLSPQLPQLSDVVTRLANLYRKLASKKLPQKYPTKY